MQWPVLPTHEEMLGESGEHHQRCRVSVSDSHQKKVSLQLGRLILGHASRDNTFEAPLEELRLISQLPVPPQVELFLRAPGLQSVELPPEEWDKQRHLQARVDDPLEQVQDHEAFRT